MSSTMAILNFSVKGQSLSVSSALPVIVSDTIDYLSAQFYFDGSWDGMQKIAHFKNGDTVFDFLLTDGAITPADHLNLGSGLWSVYVHGDKAEGGETVQRLTTNSAYIKVTASGVINGNPAPVTPASLGEQILAVAQGAKLEVDKLNSYSVKFYGAKGDGVTDDTAAIQSCIDATGADGVIVIPAGNYMVSNLSVINKPGICIMGYGRNSMLKQISTATGPLITMDRCFRMRLQTFCIYGNASAFCDTNDGVYITRCAFSSMVGMYISDMGGNGVGLHGLVASENPLVFDGTDEIVIENCFIQSNRGHGIKIMSVMDVTITDCMIEYNGMNGIYASHYAASLTPSGNIIIKSNQILSNGQKGIELVDDCARVIISENHIRYNGTQGVRIIGGRQFSLIGNDIHINGRIYSAEGVVLGYINTAIISGNFITCTDFTVTQLIGLNLVSAKNCLIIGNDLTNNSSALSIDQDSSARIFGNIGVSDGV